MNMRGRIISTAGRGRHFDVERVELTLERLVNNHRRVIGLRELRRDQTLAAAARQHSQRMSCLDFFAHSDPHDRTDVLARVRAIERSGMWLILAENLAAGQETADGVLDGWLSSPGHRANLEHPGLRFMGTSLCLGGAMGTYTTQVYGGDQLSLDSVALAIKEMTSDQLARLTSRAKTALGHR